MDKRTIERAISSNILYSQSNGCKGKRVPLQGLDLSFHDFSDKNLSGVDFSGSILTKANFTRCNLSGAYFTDANLTSASFDGADLQGVNLIGANLECAEFIGANLTNAMANRANLVSANLNRANCRSAEFENASMKGARLTHVNFEGANLQGVTLTNAILPNYKICPEKGQFHAWKKVLNGNAHNSIRIVLELLISGERTSSLVGRKCRCSKAKVLAAYKKDGTPVKETKFCSIYNKNFFYEVGKWVSEPKYNGDIRLECTSGIHFFMERSEAEDYS